MNKLLASIIGICTAIVFMFPSYLEAADEPMGERSSDSGYSAEAREDQMTMQSLRQKFESLTSARALLDQTIKNGDGEKLGKITDIVFGENMGQIEYFVVTSGGVMGMAGTKHAVPYKALSFVEKDSPVIAMQSIRFKESPLWQQDMNDPDWRNRVHEYFGISPSWDEERDMED